MIDTSKIQLTIPSPLQLIERYNSFSDLNCTVFDPIIRNGEIKCYKANLNNLHLRLRGNQLTIQNSLNKFYLGNNYTNLTYTQLNQAVQIIQNSLGVSIREAKVINFEFGAVIVDNDISTTLSSLGHYKGKYPFPMHDNGIVYGMFYSNSTHRIKIYDKSSEVKRREGSILTKNFLRVEKLYKRAHLKSLKCLKENPIITFGDLISRKTLEILSNDLIDSLCKIEVRPHPYHFNNMSLADLSRWYALQDPYFRNYLKKYHPDTLKNNRSKYNKIMQEYPNNEHDNMIQQLQEKLSFCLNN